jgi:DNA-binding SARP family transcriptional activator
MEMANLELKVLGGLSLRRNGLLIPDLKTQKGLALLCYLAVTRQPASRAALAGLLWPDMPEADAHMNLRKVVFRLKPLADHLVVSRATLAWAASTLAGARPARAASSGGPLRRSGRL